MIFGRTLYPLFTLCALLLTLRHIVTKALFYRLKLWRPLQDLQEFIWVQSLLKKVKKFRSECTCMYVCVCLCLCVHLDRRLLIYWLTHSIEQSHSWEANWISANQEIPHILWNPKVYYCIYKCPPPVPILIKFNYC